MSHQNLSRVDWCKNIYFNLVVQLIDDVLAILVANMLDQLLPWCSRLISCCLVTIFEDIVTQICAETFLVCAICIGLVVSSDASPFMSGVAVASAASISSLPAHCKMRRNISWRRYDQSRFDALLLLSLYFQCYNQSSIDALLFLRLSLLASAVAVYLILDRVELRLSPWWFWYNCCSRVVL